MLKPFVKTIGGMIVALFVNVLCGFFKIIFGLKNCSDVKTIFVFLGVLWVWVILTQQKF